MELKLPKIYFSQFFGIKKKQLDDCGAININLLNDTPLFIDPFLLFASDNPEYKKLNDRIINYLIFLKYKSKNETVDDSAIRIFYMKSEVYQNWLGYSFTGNKGKGFGYKRGQLLNQAFFTFFKNIGEDSNTDSGHFEKFRLFNKGTGADTISDFITNLIIDWLAAYTEDIAVKCNIEQKQSFPITYFDDNCEISVRNFNLPFVEYEDVRGVLKREYILLTPKDIVARDLMHISVENFHKKFERIPSIMDEYFPQVKENIILREHLNEYISKILEQKKNLSEKDIENYKESFEEKYEQLINIFVSIQEKCQQEAFDNNKESVNETETIYTKIVSGIFTEMGKYRSFLERKSDSFKTALNKAIIMKNVVEAHSNLVHYKSILSESDLHRVFKYCISECDFLVDSIGSEIKKDLLLRIALSKTDSTNIEMRVAANLSDKKDIKIYDEALLRINGVLVVFFHTDDQYYKVMRLFNSCGLSIDEYKKIVLIDARLIQKNLMTMPSIFRRGNTIARKIFISYTHKAKDKEAGVLADARLSAILECDGTSVTRDEKSNTYKTDLVEFMKTIKAHDFVVAIISDNYFKSQACMFEAAQLMKSKL